MFWLKSVNAHQARARIAWPRLTAKKHTIHHPSQIRIFTYGYFVVCVAQYVGRRHPIHSLHNTRYVQLATQSNMNSRIHMNRIIYLYTTWDENYTNSSLCHCMMLLQKWKIGSIHLYISHEKCDYHWLIWRVTLLVFRLHIYSLLFQMSQQFVFVYVSRHSVFILWNSLNT